jgi:hypothetical protein
MPYTPAYEMWRIEVRTAEKDAIFEVMLDLGHAQDYPLPNLPWFFGVRIPMTNCNANGQPAEEELTRLNTVENRIREVVRGREGTFVGRRQGLGNRDLLFYFERRPSGLDDRIRASVGMEILFISKADPQWQGYDQLLPDARGVRAIKDGHTIAELVGRNADPDREHAVVHTVQTSLQKAAEKLQEFMGEKLGLDDVTIEPMGRELVVSGTQRTPLDSIKIGEISYKLEQSAPKARAEYLGWTAMPVGDNVATGEDGDGDLDLDLDLDDLDLDLDVDVDAES